MVWSNLTRSALAVVCGLASDKLLWSVVGVVELLKVTVRVCCLELLTVEDRRRASSHGTSSAVVSWAWLVDVGSC